MNLETFFEKFVLFAETPNAVAKMRELILDLAVHGHLLSTQRTFVNHPTEPFDLPEDWEWKSLNEVANCRSGTKVNSESLKESDWVLDLEDIDGTKGDVIAHAMFSERLSLSTKASFQTDDVLFGKLRPYLNKVVVANKPGFCTPEIIPIRPFPSLLSSYLRHFFRSPHFLRYSASKSYGMKMPRLGTKDLEATRIPLPPLAEQKRIVAKVDELMALCDQLEAQQKEREERAKKLTQASLARFAKDPTPENLQFIFHESYDVTPADLRKAILSLAVRGKLVEQDPEDEPAEESLYKCGLDLRRWRIEDSMHRYKIPTSWYWIRFGGVGHLRLGKMLDVQKNRGELKPYLRNTNVQWLRFTLHDVKDMRVEKREEEEYRLKNGDLLICEGGEPGRCAIWRDEVSEMYFQKALHRVRPCAAILSEFLALNLQVDCQTRVLDRYFTGATIKHLTGRSLSLYPVPIPPLAEQRRIVAKVDELMALVDEMEAKIAESRKVGEKLLEAVVGDCG